MENQDVKLHIEDLVLTLHVGRGIVSDRFIWNTARHNNASYELHIILRGTCTLDFDSESHTMSAGDAIIIAPGEYHEPHVITEDFERLSLTISSCNERFRQLLRQAVSKSVVFKVEPDALQLCSGIIREYSGSLPFRKAAVHALFAYLLVEVLRSLSVANQPANDVTGSAEDWRPDIIDNFFQDRRDCYGIAQELAETLHLSTRQLTREMVAHYGMNFRQKLWVSRMDHAAWLLRTSEKSVGEISRIVGYSSETTFFKNFKKRYHVTPLQYRKDSHKGTD